MERRYVYDDNGNQLFDKNSGEPYFFWDVTIKNRKSYILRILEWLSQGINVFTFGHQDLTFSQRVGGWLFLGDRKGKLAVKIIDSIFFWDKDHCKNAWRNKV